MKPWSPQILGVLLLTLTTTVAAGAEEQGAASKRPPTAAGKATASRSKTKASMPTASAAGKSTVPEGMAGRYQMLKAGERIVILDTQTGETRIIEPEPPRAVQQVDVGRAWVVVTVLGNASSSERRTSPVPTDKRP